jgi:penicillin-binding protein 1C
MSAMTSSHGLLAAWALAALAALACSAAAADEVPQFVIPRFEEVRAAHHPSDWLITARDGEPLQRVRRDSKVRREAWLALDQVSPAMQAALVTAEDKRFWNHGGVDWAAFAQAALDNVSGRNTAPDGRSTVRGASTLTMQLAGMLNPDLHPAPGKRRSFGQKWDQAQAARVIERTWSKPQIFEAYLNLVSWRGETAGLPAASQAWFGKQPDGLDLTEAALLSALIRQPQAAPARVGERACAIIAMLPEEVLAANSRPACANAKLRAVLAFSKKPAADSLDYDL